MSGPADHSHDDSLQKKRKIVDTTQGIDQDYMGSLVAHGQPRVREAKASVLVSGGHTMSCVLHLLDCTVSDPVIISDPVKVTVTLKDIFGSPVVNQSKDIEVHCNKEEEFLQNIHIEEESRGQYHIWYNPKRREGHSLSVYWRGLQVNHEEIKVLVRDYKELEQTVEAVEGITEYGRTKMRLSPFLLAKGPNDELIFGGGSTRELVVFDKYLQYSYVIGEAGSGNGKFQAITGIAVDKKGYLYVGDRELNCIQKFKLSGEFISQFGSQGRANSQFQSPYGLVLSQSGLLFVCDYFNDRVQVFQNEQFSYCFGDHGTEPGSFFRPVDLALNNSEDQLFIADIENNRVQVFTVKGQFLKLFGNGIPITAPHGIHCTTDGHLLVTTGNETHRVLVFEENGKFKSAIKGGDCFSFKNATGVIMMDSGHIIINNS